MTSSVDRNTGLGFISRDEPTFQTREMLPLPIQPPLRLIDCGLVPLTNQYISKGPGEQSAFARITLNDDGIPIQLPEQIENDVPKDSGRSVQHRLLPVYWGQREDQAGAEEQPIAGIPYAMPSAFLNYAAGHGFCVDDPDLRYVVPDTVLSPAIHRLTRTYHPDIPTLRGLGFTEEGIRRQLM